MHAKLCNVTHLVSMCSLKKASLQYEMRVEGDDYFELNSHIRIMIMIISGVSSI